MKEKSMMDAHCRLLIDANELTKKAAKAVTAVGIVNGIGATFSAVGRGGDATHDWEDWETDLANTLVEAAKALGKANDEIHKAIEIVMENEGTDKEREE